MGIIIKKKLSKKMTMNESLVFVNTEIIYFSRRGVLFWNHWNVNDGDIQTDPFFNAANTVVGRDGESDDENTYRPDSTVFRVRRKRFLGREHDFMSEYLSYNIGFSSWWDAEI